jgi:hypothetical protein
MNSNTTYILLNQSNCGPTLAIVIDGVEKFVCIKFRRFE